MSLPTCIKLSDIQEFLGDKNFNEAMKNLQNNKYALNELKPNLNLHQLLQWSMDHGLILFFKYLYISKKVPFPTRDIQKHLITKIENKELEASIKLPLATGSSQNTKMTLQSWDKTSIKHKDIQIYLFRMRNYSKYKYDKGLKCFVWQFNDKYLGDYPFFK